MNDNNITAIVVSFIIGFTVAVFFCCAFFGPTTNSSNEKRYNNQNNYNEGSNEIEDLTRNQKETEAEASRKSEEELIRRQQENEEIEKRRKEEQEETKERLENWLEEKGFVKNNDNEICSRITAANCYVKDGYVAKLRSSYIDYYKPIKLDTLAGYNLEEDISYFSKLNDITIPDYLISQLKEYIGTFGLNTTSNFNIQIDNLYFSFRWYSNYIIYSFSTRNFDSYESLLPEYIDIFNPGNTVEEKNNNRRALYNIIMSNNKEHYKYVDYAVTHFDDDSNNLCNIKYITRDGFTFDSSFCHGGTSSTYFRVTEGKSASQNYESVILEIKKDAFVEKYIDILNKDLEYFNKKIGYKHKLSDDDMTELRNLVENKKDNISLTLSDNLQVDIKLNSIYYAITYNIR